MAHIWSQCKDSRYIDINTRPGATKYQQAWNSKHPKVQRTNNSPWLTKPRDGQLALLLREQIRLLSYFLTTCKGVACNKATPKAWQDLTWKRNEESPKLHWQFPIIPILPNFAPLVGFCPAVVPNSLLLKPGFTFITTSSVRQCVLQGEPNFESSQKVTSFDEICELELSRSCKHVPTRSPWCSLNISFFSVVLPPLQQPLALSASMTS